MPTTPMSEEFRGFPRTSESEQRCRQKLNPLPDPEGNKAAKATKTERLEIVSPFCPQ